MSTPLDRLRAARRIYAEMLAQKTDHDECAVLVSNIAALDKQIEVLGKQARK